MTTTSKAKIFLAEERGMNQTNHFRSLHTFNFGKFFNEHKIPVGNIYLLNDDALDGGKSLSMLVKEDSFVVLLPVFGAIQYEDSLKQQNLVAAGQVQIVALREADTLSISNPFKNDLVNFIQVWIRNTKKFNLPATVETYDVNKLPNDLVNISGTVSTAFALPFNIAVGKFKGRGETVYQPRQQDAIVFVFVLEGAFEVEGRLLHARDGLALWGNAPVEMEALSNDAILLLFEQQQ